MRPIIQKQQQILKQNLSRFENRATQITYSLNKMQYLLYNNHEIEQNKEFILNEYSFLKTLVNQVGQDLNIFLTNNSVLLSNGINSQMLMQPLIPNLQSGIINNDIKLEQEDEENIDKDLSIESKFEVMDQDESDDDDEEYDEQSQQKSNQHSGAATRKKIIEKDKMFQSAFSSNSHNRIIQNGHNNSSSSSESQGYMGNGNHGNRQVRKKKYSSDLRKKLVEEVKKKNFSYRKICKKYNINYGTAYYLINSIQKELAEQAQGGDNQGGNNVLKNSISGIANGVSVNGGSEIQGQVNQQNNKGLGQTTDKQNVGETGRTKYQEEFKQQLYVESACGLSYKDLSDKYKVSYETCYYLISTIKNQAQKDSQLNKQLKEQIQVFQETLDQNKQVSQVKNGKQVNTIPTTTTLTRAQQAILNGTKSQGFDGSKSIKVENNTIAIDDEQDEKVIEFDEKKVINLDDKKESNINEQSEESDEINKQKILKVLQKEEDDDEDFMEQEDNGRNSTKSEDNADEHMKQDEDFRTSENSKESSKNLNKIKKIPLDQQSKNSQGSVKTSGSTQEINTSTD